MTKRPEGEADPGEEYEGRLDPNVFRIEGRYPGSWVRLTHLPTGLVADSRDSEATQVQNRDTALDKLREMLRERGQEPDF
jgi:hypothetical protein